MIISVILVQFLLILWLSSWAVGDYLNNQYVKAYVDSTFQSMIWIFGALFLVIIMGSVLGLVVRRSRHMKTLELVGTSPTTHTPTPTVIHKTMTRGESPSVVSVSSVGTVTEAPKPTVELHPAVAALKAELSDARMSLGLASVTTGSPMPAGPAQKFEDQRSSPVIPSQLQTLQTSPPRPTSPVLGQSTSSTVIRPNAPSPGQNGPTVQGYRPPPSTIIRPMLPSAPPSQHLSPPLPRALGPNPGPAQSVAPGSQQQPSSSTPKDVSTVITGIMPPLKKKAEQSSQTGQNGSQQ